MTTIILAVTVLTALPQASYTACWQPVAGVVAYEVRGARAEGGEWTPLRYGVTCPSTGLCCIDAIAWRFNRPEDDRHGDAMRMQVRATSDTEIQSVPLIVNQALVGRVTSAQAPAAIAVPILKGVQIP